MSVGASKQVSVKAEVDVAADMATLHTLRNTIDLYYNQLKSIETTKKRIGTLSEKEIQNQRELQNELEKSKNTMAEMRQNLEGRRPGVTAIGKDLLTPQSSIAAQLGLSESQRLGAGAYAAGVAAQMGNAIRDALRAEARAGGTEDGLPENRAGGMHPVLAAIARQFPGMRHLVRGGGGWGGGAGGMGGGGGIGAVGAAAIGGVAGGIAGAGIDMAVSAVRMMLGFVKESVQYWNQIQKSSLTLATNMGTTANEMERTHEAMLGQGRGLGFSPHERQQISAGVMQGGFGVGTATDTMNIARFLGMGGEQTAGFHAGFGRSVGARFGGADPFMRIASAMIPAGMAHDPQSYLQAMSSAFNQSASVLGSKTTSGMGNDIVRYMAGIQSTSVGEGQFGVQFNQEIQAGMKNPMVQMMLFDELRRKHPDWDYLKIQDAIRNPNSIENIEAVQDASKRAGGGRRGQGLILSELFGFSEEKRQAFMDLKPADILSESQSRTQVFAGADARMSTSGGLVGKREEAMNELMYAIGDRLGPAANKAALALERVAGAVVGTGKANPLAPGGAMSMSSYLFNPFGLFSQEQ